MRSSSAILAFAVLAASPALSAPLKAFDVEARAISDAGAQDAVIEEAMQVLHKRTPSTPPHAREIVGALQRELTDEELQLVARTFDPITGLRVIEGAAPFAWEDVAKAPAVVGNVAKKSKQDFLRIAGLIGGGAAAGGGLVEAENYWNWRRTVTPPAQAREIVRALRRELTDEEQQLVARTIEEIVAEGAPAVVGDVAEEAPAVVGDVVKTTKNDWARVAALFGGGAAAGGGLAAFANYLNSRPTVTPPAQAREIVEALPAKRELIEAFLAARSLYDLD